MHYYLSIKENIPSLYDIYFDNLQKIGEIIKAMRMKAKTKMEKCLKNI